MYKKSNLVVVPVPAPVPVPEPEPEPEPVVEVVTVAPVEEINIKREQGGGSGFRGTVNLGEINKCFEDGDNPYITEKETPNSAAIVVEAGDVVTLEIRIYMDEKLTVADLKELKTGNIVYKVVAWQSNAEKPSTETETPYT